MLGQLIRAIYGNSQEDRIIYLFALALCQMSAPKKLPIALKTVLAKPKQVKIPIKARAGLSDFFASNLDKKSPELGLSYVRYYRQLKQVAFHF